MFVVCACAASSSAYHVKTFLPSGETDVSYSKLDLQKNTT